MGPQAENCSGGRRMLHTGRCTERRRDKLSAKAVVGCGGGQCAHLRRALLQLGQLLAPPLLLCIQPLLAGRRRRLRLPLAKQCALPGLLRLHFLLHRLHQALRQALHCRQGRQGRRQGHGSGRGAGEGVSAQTGACVCAAGRGTGHTMPEPAMCRDGSVPLARIIPHHMPCAHEGRAVCGDGQPAVSCAAPRAGGRAGGRAPGNGRLPPPHRSRPTAHPQLGPPRSAAS